MCIFATGIILMIPIIPKNSQKNNMPGNDKFLSPLGDYKNLIAFKKSECIYDITLYFVEHYLPMIGDRTVDQMKQAARSGKQNIAEGNETGTTSMEACIKLVNVAKASLKELQEDYEDYLRNHGNQIWDVDSQQCRNARQWCKDHSEPADYQRVCQLRDDITLANVALVLIHQTDFLLRRLLEKLKKDFLENGGIKEQMSQARRNWREQHGMGYLNGNYGRNEKDERDERDGKNWKNGNDGKNNRRL